ncbi:DUF3016 domain-containing protein [Pseudoduganella sp. OTU4001]|uniref:DUF3016 domain-containing protein n=1 Tax=Pseudoduganella sp. OTU4001 TaxID=3043854 RepID=UPI00313D005F
MKRHSRYWPAAALMLAAAGAASAGTVKVTYQEPKNFHDMPFAESERTQVLKELTAHFDKLAKRLPLNQQLNVTVTDIDLAGRVEPTRRNAMNDLRILRGQADWPTMSLSYSLEQDGKVIASGSENLKNMLYLDRMNRYPGGDALRYEKPMLDDWFKDTFGAPAQLSQK